MGGKKHRYGYRTDPEENQYKSAKQLAGITLNNLEAYQFFPAFIIIAITVSSTSLEYQTGESNCGEQRPPPSTPQQTDELFDRKNLALGDHHAVDYQCRA